jgi:hypothetical protein
MVVGRSGQQLVQYVLDVGPHVQVVATRRADDRQEGGRPISGGYAPQEEPVLSAQGALLRQLFGVVVANGHPTVAEVQIQGAPMIAQIADRFGEEALGKHPRGRLAVKPRPQAIQHAPR